MLKTTEIKQYKEKLFQKQSGICPLCGENLLPDIQQNHLDHDHTLSGINEGRCRSILHPWCNKFEGVVLHHFHRQGMTKNNVNYVQYLKNLVEYLSKDYSKNPKHPAWLSDKVKEFSKMKLSEMKLLSSKTLKTREDYILDYKNFLKNESQKINFPKMNFR